MDSATSPRSVNRGNAGKGRPKGSKNICTDDVRDFCRNVLESKPYREKARQRVVDGEAPQLEVLMYHYAYGKPREAEGTPQTLIQINMPSGKPLPASELPSVLVLPTQGERPALVEAKVDLGDTKPQNP